MKAEYDFSKGERGKFYHSDAEFHLPIYLDPSVAEFISQIAVKKSRRINDIVNAWLKRDIELIESIIYSFSDKSFHGKETQFFQKTGFLRIYLSEKL